ncbi:CDP-glycerol glycerophosphotransferase family protein [Limnovirga soli]|uniref:Uncharacterized protein n=1 Tax=Limnovirga soli TaxID=2656915 RepID=A0A8J8FH89_9BACT|nr:CDP-glycerol glycerophosphotransferase family protein [Limnovirga soli]NNV56587.1 hypothetical protein [Limnovirga soli]
MEKRILVAIVGQGSISHIIRTGMLQQMQLFCTPVVAMLWQQDDLINELTQQGFEVSLMPAYKTSAAYAGVRDKLNMWYKWYKVKSPSTGIEERYRDTHYPAKKRMYNWLKRAKARTLFSLYPPYIKNLLQQENELMQAEPVYTTYANWLNELDVQGIFTVTPFLHELDLIARIAATNNIQLLASIHSFDNVTKRGWVSTFFQQYIVWNKYNKAELTRIHPPLANHITIAGAPQFDFHYNQANIMPKNEWQQLLGLPANKRVILYGAGIWWLFPNEPQYVTHLDEAITNGQLPADTVILLRCHPLDYPERWKAALASSKHIALDAYTGTREQPDRDNITPTDISKLISTLQHTDVHINLCSTMAVDGSVFNKPQIGPAYDEVQPATQHLLKDMYRQEHYIPIIQVQGVSLANSKQELITLVNKALAQPSAFTANCAATVETITSYRDGQSTNRVLQVIRQFFGE